MAQEIGAITQIWNEAFKERRVPKEILASDFAMENATTAVTTKTYSGAQGIEEWFTDFYDVFADGWRYDVEPIAFGQDCAVARIILTGRGRASGAPLDMSHWGVVWIREGQVVRAVGFMTKRDALEAAGLSEPQM
jgi:hypothetical protein